MLFNFFKEIVFIFINFLININLTKITLILKEKNSYKRYNINVCLKNITLSKDRLV